MNIIIINIIIFKLCILWFEAQNYRIAKNSPEVLFKCDFIESFGDGANKIYANQVKYGKDVPDYSKSDKFNVTLILNTEISSLRLAKIVDRLDDSGFKLEYKQLRFLSEYIRNDNINRGEIEYFLKNNILSKTEQGYEFINEYSDLNTHLIEKVDVNGGLNGELNNTLYSLFKLIKNNPNIQANKCSEILNRPVRTIEKQIKSLIDRRLIERRGSKKTGGYYICD